MTTEKDATKLKNFNREFNGIDVYYIPIEVKLGNAKEFDKQILDYVEKN